MKAETERVLGDLAVTALRSKPVRKIYLFRELSDVKIIARAARTSKLISVGLKVRRWNVGHFEFTFPNGSSVRLLADPEPDQLQGLVCGVALFDEVTERVLRQVEQLRLAERSELQP